MTAFPVPHLAVQVQKQQNPFDTTETRTPVVEMPRPDILRTPFSGAFKDAVLAASNIARASHGAAQGVRELGPDTWDIAPLGSQRNGGLVPLVYDISGPEVPTGAAYTDRFELTDQSTAMAAFVGTSTFAGFTDGRTGAVESLAALGLQAGVDFPID